MATPAVQLIHQLSSLRQSGPLRDFARILIYYTRKKIQFEMHILVTTPCDTSVNDKLRKT